MKEAVGTRELDDEFWAARALFEQGQEAFFTEINEASTFDVTSYYRQRQTAEPWVTVDIGPGTMPSGLNRTFTGESRYVAFEPALNPWFAMRHDVEETYVDILSSRKDENICLRDVPHTRDAQGRPVFSAAYDFPSDGASEVFVPYVFDDNTVHADPTKNAKILAEAYRMLQPGGALIIQDAAHNMVGWLGEMLSEHGFMLVYGQPARPGRDDPRPILYTARFAALIKQLGLHFDGHEHLSLLIAQKPAATT